MHTDLGDGCPSPYAGGAGRSWGQKNEFFQWTQEIAQTLRIQVLAGYGHRPRTPVAGAAAEGQELVPQLTRLQGQLGDARGRLATDRHPEGLRRSEPAWKWGWAWDRSSPGWP